MIRRLLLVSVLLAASRVAIAQPAPLPMTHADSVLRMSDELLHGAPITVEIPRQKCATELMFEAYRLRHVRGQIETQADGTINQASMVSPQGFFTIYFDSIGPNAAAPDYVQSVARTADSAYRFEIETLHYPKPPFTDADSTFHLHIVNQPNGIYGYTTPTDAPSFGSSPSGREKYRTYIVIDNDFVESTYPTHGHDAMHVTVFHEFQHVIQYGTYGIDGLQKDGYFKELTSVWMETRSHPEVKDYLQYLSSYFTTIELSLDGSITRGYSEAIWFQFLEKRFGDAMPREVWEHYSASQPDPLYAMQDALAQHGSSFCTEYMRFGNSLFFTGRRFAGSSIFPDARAFPADELVATKVQPGVPTPINLGAVVASINYFYAGFGGDTVALTVARDTNRTVISDGTITILTPTTYQAIYAYPANFCDTLAGYVRSTADVFPQPFVVRSGAADSVSILASPSGQRPVSVALDIYTMNMQLVTHIERNPEPFTGEYYVTWSGTDDAGHRVASGIYLYTIETDGVRREGKIAVIRAK